MFRKIWAGRKSVRTLAYGLGLFFSSAVSSQLGLLSYLVEQPLTGSFFGSSIAVLDWNGDGDKELVIGRPGLDIGAATNNGGLFVGRVSGEQVGSGFNGGIASCEASGDAGTGALMGSTLTVGDFNGDGFEDLAVGMPGADGAIVNNAGAVCVIYGGDVASFNDLPRLRIDAQLLSATNGEPNSEFGATLAAGDINNDGHDDLAIGWPKRDLGKGGELEDAGAVIVLLGAPSGLQANSTDLIFLSHSDHAIYQAEDNELFGSSLAIGPFVPELSPHPQIDDLMVGVPFDQEGAGGGSVYGYRGDDTDPLQEEFPPLYVGSTTWDLAGTAQPNDAFGYSLAAGDFDGDGLVDLAVGIPGDNDLGLANQAGAVMVLYGPGGLFDDREQIFFESIIDGHNDGVRAFDRFGEVLAAGDFDQSGEDDLAIGAPLDNVFDVANSGEVTVLYGSTAGLSVLGAQVFAGILFGESQIGSQFGGALTATSLFGDQGPEDLLIGIPLIDITTVGRGPADLTIGLSVEQLRSEKYLGDDIGNDNGEDRGEIRGGVNMFVDAGAVRVVRTLTIFADGFESGSTAGWSATNP